MYCCMTACRFIERAGLLQYSDKSVFLQEEMRNAEIIWYSYSYRYTAYRR